jgi:hypothetical protein
MTETTSTQLDPAELRARLSALRARFVELRGRL